MLTIIFADLGLVLAAIMLGLGFLIYGLF